MNKKEDFIEKYKEIIEKYDLDLLTFEKRFFKAYAKQEAGLKDSIYKSIYHAQNDLKQAKSLCEKSTAGLSFFARRRLATKTAQLAESIENISQILQEFENENPANEK